jgi:hypothetical protein
VREKSSDQFVTVLRSGRAASHVVFMGHRRTADNFDALTRAIRVINSPKAFIIGARRITVSTAVIPEKIEALCDLDIQIELAVSLHAAEDGLRDRLVPLNRRHPIGEVLGAWPPPISSEDQPHRSRSNTSCSRASTTGTNMRARSGNCSDACCARSPDPLQPASGLRLQGSGPRPCARVFAPARGLTACRSQCALPAARTFCRLARQLRLNARPAAAVTARGRPGAGKRKNRPRKKDGDRKTDGKTQTGGGKNGDGKGGNEKTSGGGV